MDRPNGGKWMSRMSSNPVPTRDMGEGPSPAKSNGGRHRGNRGDNRRSNHTHLSNNSSDANRANHNAGGFPNKGGAVVDDNRVAFRGIRDSLDRGDGPGEQRFASLRDNFHQSTNGNCHPNPSSQQSHNGQNYRSHPGQQGEVIPPPPRSAQRAKHYQSAPNSASTARFGGEAFHPSVSGLQHYTHTTASHPTTQPCRWTSTVHSNNSTSSTTNSHATSPDVQAVHGRQSLPAPHDALHLGTGGGGVTRSTGGLNPSPSLPKGTSPTTSGIFAPFNPMGSTTPIIPLPPQYGNYHGNGSTSEFSIGGSPSHSAQQMLPLPPAMFIGGISTHSDSHSPTFTNAPPSGHTQGHTHVDHSGSTLRRIMGSEQTNQEDGTDPARFTVSASGMDRLSHGTGCSINPIILAPRSHEGTTSLWGVEPATGSRTLSTTTSHEFADLESLSAVFSTAPRIADQQPTTNHSSTDITQQLFSQLTGGDGDDDEKAVLGNGTTLRYIAPELSSSSPLQNLFSELTQPSPTEDMNDAFGTASSSTVWTSLTASRREDHVLVEDLQQLDAPVHRDPSAQNGCVLHALSKLRKQLSSTDTRAVPVGIDGTTPKHARLDHSNKSLGGSPAFLSHSGSLTKELSASSELPHPPVNGSVRGHRTVLEAPVVTLESFACIFREMSPAVARREQILEKRQLPHALASRLLWPPRTESEVTQLLKSCEATKLLRHLNILHFSRQHLKGVQELFDTWARNGIPAPDVGFGAYYFYVKEKSEKVLCMKHNGRGAKPGHGYGKCDFESRRPNSTCRYEHVCLFCRSRDHGWFEEGKCEGYQQLLAEIEDLGVTEKDIEEMLDAMERADTPPS